MKVLKWLLVVLGILLVFIQFIRPQKNLSNSLSPHTINNGFAVPQQIQSILQRSCYDCHSNNTVYPWYAEIEPVGWWLNKHIQDGRRGLNYDEYTTYRLMKQYHRFKDVIDQIEKEKMPLPSYLLIHRYAKLSAEEKGLLIQWCTAMRDSMKVKFPVDSLERKPRN